VSLCVSVHVRMSVSRCEGVSVSVRESVSV